MGEKIKVSLSDKGKNNVDREWLCKLIGRLGAVEGLDVPDLREGIVQLQNLLAELEASVDVFNSKAAELSCDQKRESPIIFERDCEVPLKQLKDLEGRWREYLRGKRLASSRRFQHGWFLPLLHAPEKEDPVCWTRGLLFGG